MLVAFCEKKQKNFYHISLSLFSVLASQTNKVTFKVVELDDGVPEGKRDCRKITKVNTKVNATLDYCLFKIIKYKGRNVWRGSILHSLEEVGHYESSSCWSHPRWQIQHITPIAISIQRKQIGIGHSKACKTKKNILPL